MAPRVELGILKLDGLGRLPIAWEGRWQCRMAGRRSGSPWLPVRVKYPGVDLAGNSGLVVPSLLPGEKTMRRGKSRKTRWKILIQHVLAAQFGGKPALLEELRWQVLIREWDEKGKWFEGLRDSHMKSFARTIRPENQGRSSGNEGRESIIGDAFRNQGQGIGDALESRNRGRF